MRQAISTSCTERTTRRGLAAVLLVVVFVFGAERLAAQDQPERSVIPPPSLAEVWSREPYLVAVSVSMTRDYEPLTRAEESRIQAKLDQSLRMSFSPLCEFPSDNSTGAPHKRFEFQLRDRAGYWRIRCREYDELTQSHTEWIEESTLDADRIGCVATDLAVRSFRQTALIDSMRGEVRQLTFRGESRLTADFPSPTSRPLEVWLLYLNKAREIEKRQRAPWSYLVHELPPRPDAPPTQKADAAKSDSEKPAAEIASGNKSADQPAANSTDKPAENADAAAKTSIEPPAAKWQFVTGVRAAIGTRNNRVWAVGLAVPQTGPFTELVLRPWKSTVRRIPGVDLVVRDRAVAQPDSTADNTAADAKQEFERFVSDRSGVVRLPAFGPPTIRMLEVLSGKQVLARVPIIPGARPQDVLELPDDELRLRVEGDLAILQGAVIDVVSRRAVLMARIRRDARQGKIPEADTGLAALDQLPKLETMAAELSRIEGTSLEEAKKERDRVAQSRIRKLCAETRDMLTRFLGPEPVKLLREEVAELRAAQKEQADLEAGKTAPARKPGLKIPIPIPVPAANPAATAPAATPAAKPAPGL